MRFATVLDLEKLAADPGLPPTPPLLPARGAPWKHTQAPPIPPRQTVTPLITRVSDLGTPTKNPTTKPMVTPLPANPPRVAPLVTPLPATRPMYAKLGFATMLGFRKVATRTPGSPSITGAPGTAPPPVGSAPAVRDRRGMPRGMSLPPTELGLVPAPAGNADVNATAPASTPFRPDGASGAQGPVKPGLVDGQLDRSEPRRGGLEQTEYPVKAATPKTTTGPKMPSAVAGVRQTSPNKVASETPKPGLFFTPGKAMPSGANSGAVTGGQDGWS